MRNIVVLSFALAGCGPPTEEVVVSGIREPCLQFITTMCLQALTPEGTENIDSIDGFDHRWGVEAVVRFHREENDPPVQDASSVRLVLEEIVEERPIAGGFSLEFPAPEGRLTWFTRDQSGLLLADFTLVDCDPATCSAIVDATTAFSVAFEVVGDEHLRATAVE